MSGLWRRSIGCSSTDGMLVIGHADRLDRAVSMEIQAVGDPGCFTYRRADHRIERGVIDVLVERAEQASSQWPVQEMRGEHRDCDDSC